MAEEIIGYRTVTDITGILGEDGLWKVTLLLRQYKLVGKEWQVKEALVSALDADYVRAMNSCSLTMSTYLKSVHNDLFEETNDQVNGLKN